MASVIHEVIGGSDVTLLPLQGHPEEARTYHFLYSLFFYSLFAIVTPLGGVLYGGDGCLLGIRIVVGSQEKP